MALSNTEKQAAWRARQAANKGRVTELEAEVERLRSTAGSKPLSDVARIQRNKVTQRKIKEFCNRYDIPDDEWDSIERAIIDAHWDFLARSNHEETAEIIVWEIEQRRDDGLCLVTFVDQISEAMTERPWEDRDDD
jgi:hypothetical protein